jgi:DNA-binding transcriptional ArsR family regulator
MIEFRLSVAALGNTRFGYSPLAEVASSVRVLGLPGNGGVLEPWRREIAGSVQTVDLELLRAVVPRAPLAPDFMFAWSTDPATTIDEQVEELAAQPLDVLRSEIETVWPRGLPPTLVRLFADPGGARRLADVVWDYWQAAIAPYWSRMRAVIDDDVAYRASRVLRDGLFDLLTDLHPQVSLEGRRLLVDKPHLGDVSYGESDLTLIPSVFVWPHLLVGQNREGLFDLNYPARGIGRVWEGLAPAEPASDALATLVGRTRARILRELTVPATTTQLARRLGQSPGTVNTHLGVLRDAGLLTSRRSGRNVYYRGTNLAASILAAADPAGAEDVG